MKTKKTGLCDLFNEARSLPDDIWSGLSLLLDHDLRYSTEEIFFYHNYHLLVKDEFERLTPF